MSDIPFAVSAAPCPGCKLAPVVRSYNSVDFYANCPGYFCDNHSGHGLTADAAVEHWNRLRALESPAVAAPPTAETTDPPKES